MADMMNAYVLQQAQQAAAARKKNTSLMNALPLAQATGVVAIPKVSTSIPSTTKYTGTTTATPTVKTPATTMAATATTPTATGVSMPPANTDSLTSESDPTSLIGRQKAALLAAANSRYQSSLGTLNAEAEKVPGYYTDVKNNASSQSDLSRQNFNEYAAATGLNSGAGGQAELARLGVLQGSLTSADRDMAQKLADFALQRSQLANDLTASQSEIDAQMASTELSQANTDRSRADQLSQNTYNQNEATAANLAQYGDFSGYKALGYSDAQITTMSKAYQLQQVRSAASSSGGGGGLKSQTLAQLDSDMNDIYKMNSLGGELTEQGKLAMVNYITQYGGDYTPQLLSKWGLTSGGTPTATPTAETASGVNNTTDSRNGGTDWVMVGGYGRLTWPELKTLVDNGQVVEKVVNGKYTYTKVR